MKLGTIVIVKHLGLWQTGKAIAFGADGVTVKLSKRETIKCAEHEVLRYKEYDEDDSEAE